MTEAGQRQPRRVLRAGVVLGAGLGGFVDGIVFHQLLQWHNMLSARIATDNLLGARINMFWDGVFHAAVWLVTVAGVVLLFRAGRVQRHGEGAAHELLGGALIGWGVFNAVEGLVNHFGLGLHHVAEFAADPLPGDLAFLASGVLLVLVGAWVARRGRRLSPAALDPEPEGRRRP
jgi:uncharacterized membrane protein